MRKRITKYTVPCGLTFEMKYDVGFAHGIRVGAEKDGEYVYSNNDCKNCTLGCSYNGIISTFNEKTREIQNRKVIHCVGYSDEYLKRKDSETVKELDATDIGKYIIELIIQQGDYRALLYLKGKAKSVGLLDLVNTTYLEDFFKKYYDKGMEAYSLWMTSMKTGQSQQIEFESLDEIVAGIVSVRFIGRI